MRDLLVTLLVFGSLPLILRRPFVGIIVWTWLGLMNPHRQRLEWLVWTICVSLGFYGFKGGIWILMTGGAHQVFGPSNTFIGGNNELGLALIMIVPLLWFLVTQSKKKWLKMGLYAAMAFTLIAIVGTHSRGALLGLAGMGLMFFMKSRSKFVPLILSLIFVAALPSIMPEEWFGRMHTIETYEEDKSATERLRAWGNATRLAKERFIGGGYDVLIYYGGRDAHSIYFEVLAEHGFLGLGLFLLLGAFTWFKASKTKRLAKRYESLRWAGDLAGMLQVSLAGYAVAGAFLGLAYFDLYYLIVVCVIATNRVAVAELHAEENAREAPSPVPATGQPGLAMNVQR